MRRAVLALGGALSVVGAVGCGGAASSTSGARAPKAGTGPATCADVSRELSLVSERAHRWASMKEGGTLRVVYEYDRMAQAIASGATRLAALDVPDPELGRKVSASKQSLERLSKSVAAFERAMDAFLAESGVRWFKVQAELAQLRAACARTKTDCRALAAAEEKSGGLFGTDEIADVKEALAKTPARAPEIAKLQGETSRDLDALGASIARFDKVEVVGKQELDDFGKTFGALREKCEGALPRPSLAAGERWVTMPDVEPRRVTAVVRVPLQGKLRQQFLSFADAEQDPDRAALFRAVSDGGFGSGVVVVHEVAGERRSFVVTNEHVVKSSTNAIVQFEAGGPLSADVVLADAERDLAILALRKELPGGVGLAASPPKDQDLVFAAGFPGFGAMPSYQITRGYVSNERLALGPGMLHLQHTAPIDPGSSGGPLLSGGKELVGLNTKKGIGRENVGIAVPSIYVVEALRAAREAPRALGDASGRRRAARRACLEFLNALDGEPGGLALLEHRVAVGLVEARGLESYNLLVEQIHELDAVLKSDPVQAFRLAVARRIADELRAARLSPFEACLGFDEGDAKDILSTDRVRFTIATRGGPRTLAVRMEQGTYKVSAFDFSDRAPAPPKKR